MHDQPGRAPCWCFMGPNPNQIRRGIAEEACELGNPQLAHRGFKLYEWIITPQRYARALQRFAHEKWAGGGGRAREGDQVVARQSLTSLRDSRSCHIPLGCIEREADLAESATDKVRSGRSRQSDRQIGVTTRYVKRANADCQINPEVRVCSPQRGNRGSNQLISECLGRRHPDRACYNGVASCGDALEI